MIDEIEYPSAAPDLGGEGEDGGVYQRMGKEGGKRRRRRRRAKRRKKTAAEVQRGKTTGRRRRRRMLANRMGLGVRFSAIVNGGKIFFLRQEDWTMATLQTAATEGAD